MVHNDAHHLHRSFMRARLQETRQRTRNFDRLEAHANTSALVLVHDSNCNCHTCRRRSEADRLSA